MASGGSRQLSTGNVSEENDSVHHPALEAVVRTTNLDESWAWRIGPECSGSGTWAL